MATPVKKTRLSNSTFGLGSTITEEDGTLTGVRLPTSRQVLRAALWHVKKEIGPGKQNLRTKYKAASTVLGQLKVFYAKANIPVLSDTRCCASILELMNECEKIKQIPKCRREKQSTLDRIEGMNSRLDETFGIWTNDAEKTIKLEEDVMFLKSMKTDRKASFGCLDKKKDNMEKRKADRLEAETRRRQAASNEKSASQPTTISDPENSDEGSIGDEEYLTNTNSRKRRSHHRSTFTGTSAFIPHDILKRPSVVAVATRLGITPTQQAAFTEALIKESGGDATKIAKSYATADKARRSVASAISQDIKSSWIAPENATLHWDGKQISSLTDNSVKEERLPILIGTASEVKLLGVAKYPTGSDLCTGDIIAVKTSELLDSWNCRTSVRSLCFDTTASNTGHLTAACVAIQAKLGRALLWCACRHHIGEILLDHIFHDLKIETSKSPEVCVFQRLKKYWDRLPHKDISSANIDLSGYTVEAQQLLQECKTEHLNPIVKRVKYLREDYKEMAELCTFILNHEKTIDLKKPGAMHKARWMAKILYSIKICLLKDHIGGLPKGMVTTAQQQAQLHEFVVFIVYVYSGWWLQCRSAINAPWLDLCLYKTLLKYQIVNETISKSAQKALCRHLWYLTPELAILAIFSDAVPLEKLESLRKKMLEVKPTSEPQAPKNRFGTEFGKPEFPVLSETTELADLINVDSWFAVHALGLDMDFLSTNVCTWPKNDDFLNSKTRVKDLNVVNDCAERAVKMTNDFACSSKDESHFQNVLQVVESERKRKPNLRKKTQ